MPVPTLLVHRPGPAVRWAVDLLIAVAAGLLCLYAAADTPASAPPEPAWIPLLAGLALGGPLAVRRRWPIVAALVVGAASAILLAARIIPDYASPAPVTVVGAAVYLARRVRPRWANRSGTSASAPSAMLRGMDSAARTS